MSASKAAAARRALLYRAFTLEWISVVWMIAEAGIALASGIVAHSVTLVAFGADSVIELFPAGVLLWRLDVHGGTFGLVVVHESVNVLLEGVPRRASTLGPRTTRLLGFRASSQSTTFTFGHSPGALRQLAFTFGSIRRNSARGRRS